MISKIGKELLKSIRRGNVAASNVEPRQSGKIPLPVFKKMDLVLTDFSKVSNFITCIYVCYLPPMYFRCVT